MSQKSIKGTIELGKAIKSRRLELELGLTIEEAASKAGVGIKSWCRYEAGESIRSDKAKGICKTLNWHSFPGVSDTNESKFDLDEYKNHTAWSQYLSEQFGDAVALSFVIGSDIVLDYLEDDINELSKLPKGTHVGQLPVSMIKDILPEQFLMQYDYDFLYQFKMMVINLRVLARSGDAIRAHSVLQELALYLFSEESKFLIECMLSDMELNDVSGLDMLDDWCFDIFEDMDIITWLYSNIYLSEDSIYHFSHWQEKRFYI